MDHTALLEKFEYGERIGAAEKLRTFIRGGKDRVHLLCDFDRTLTAPATADGPDVTTWEILKSYLPPAGIEAYDKLFSTYRSLELSGKMTGADAVAWWNRTLGLYRDYGINIRDVKRTFLAKATIREGTAELFGYCRDNGVPTVIVSAGIRDVIDIWLEHYSVRPTLVLSTKLILDASGVITGWDRASLIHILNKDTRSHRELIAIRRDRPNTILIGDGMSDSRMADGEANVLRIRIFNPRRDEHPDRRMYRRETFGKFDLMIEDGSLEPVLALLQAMT